MAETTTAAAEERQFVAHFSKEQHILSPEKIQHDAKNKQLGASLRSLSVRDFELVRTLGTVTEPACIAHSLACTIFTPMIFRLSISDFIPSSWLVRLANPAEEDRDKVFALKVLRKVEDMRGLHLESEANAFVSTKLDYCPGGEVFSYLRKAKRFDENTARFYAAEIVLILEFLHEREGVAYRDMKPENLLLDAEGHIKLVDFGFAKRLGNSKLRKFEGYVGPFVNNDEGETYTLCGTPEYLAPEVIQSKGHTTAVDWWALGILIYEFLTGYPPFWHSNPIEIYKQIVTKPVSFPAEPAISTAAKDVIRQFCTVDRSHRLGNISGGAARVKEHPFFSGVIWDDIYYRKYRGPIIPPLRYPGDAQNFDLYPDEKEGRDPYTDELAAKWDDCFKGF
ncbi:cytochrome c oxidase subunit 1 [Ciborinia camelliae]|nr:cytochrome c oxidase subunit 1 [Ciborinia camelliae]